ncbi:SIR2 family histone deacetylase, putative [Metarhizium acridum CQMa 102]|uniref:SIR2 family histone deacetylase, putative n=1 Tax=Metarhizium acridum (strain CQMa 102) TaxID=655827 RepID=E9DYP5_METAQ|nr:SIR2 family histone deacetylase, putative [Metarhizium acridum CQMa 102]EFY91315.1 SIR2 family histone deacetylase, putative [Metarhizium acridum CQMa 102]
MPPHNDVETFHEVLRSSRRILALCGAGLSASSGLPTFRGAGGLWRMHSATKLATMRAFTTDPGLVWLFYGYRRHLALQAKPNPGHQALAALAKKNPDFLCLTQNVDSEFFNRPYLEREWAPALWGQLSTSKMFRGWTNARPFAPWSLSVDLSQRANHPPEQLCTLHGSLFDIKCTTEGCGWIQRDNFDDPFCPSLKAASEDPPPGESLPLLDPYHRIKHVPEEELPKCPKCQTGIQRPGVVWFGEELDENMLDHIDEWITKDKIVRVSTTLLWLAQ